MLNKKRVIKTVVLLFILLLVTTSVTAKGSSSYKTKKVVEPVVVDCNSFSLLQDRITCRLKNGGNASVPEPCAGLAVEKECTAFYDTAGYCYDLPAFQKNTCFRKESGYVNTPQDTWSQRWYINALLYELEEYVEEDFEKGKLSADKAGELITDIVRIKRLLLSGRELSIVNREVDEYAAKRGI